MLPWIIEGVHKMGESPYQLVLSLSLLTAIISTIFVVSLLLFQTRHTELSVYPLISVRRMTEDALLKMYEAQAIAIEKEAEASRLRRENEALTEELRQLQRETEGERFQWNLTCIQRD